MKYTKALNSKSKDPEPLLAQAVESLERKYHINPQVVYAKCKARKIDHIQIIDLDSNGLLFETLS